MARQQVSVTAWTSAPAAIVHALLCDGAGWPLWSPLGSFELEVPVSGGGAGVGAVRVFHSRISGRAYTVRERVVQIEPDRRFSYELVSGLSLRGYRADVDLMPAPVGTIAAMPAMPAMATEPAALGTQIRWSCSFDTRLRGTGWFYRRALAKLFRQMAEGLAEYAAAQAATPPPAPTSDAPVDADPDTDTDTDSRS